MSYYEVPDHCTECGIEIYPEGFADSMMCFSCWKHKKAEHDAEQSERA